MSDLPDFAGNAARWDQIHADREQRARENAYRDEVMAVPLPVQMAQARYEAEQAAAQNAQAASGTAAALQNQQTPAQILGSGDSVTNAPGNAQAIVSQGIPQAPAPADSANAPSIVPAAGTLASAAKKAPKPAIGATSSSGVNAGQVQPTIADQIEYMRRTAEIARKHGMLNPANVMQMENVISNMKAEGLNHAVALWDHGDVQGGTDAFNQIGGVRGQVIDVKDGMYDTGGQGGKIPTKFVTFQRIDAQGKPIGKPETLNTAHFMHSAAGLDSIIKQHQEGFKNDSDRIKAEADMLKAKADETRANREHSVKPENIRPYVNDGVSQLALAFGAKLDPVSKMLDMTAIKDPAGYRAASAELEAGVNDQNSPYYQRPMEAARDLGDKYARKAKLSAVGGGTASKGNAAVPSAQAAGSYSNLWK